MKRFSNGVEKFEELREKLEEISGICCGNFASTYFGGNFFQIL